jgi:hypothetical protein
MESGPRQVWLRRAAIWASFFKAIPCAALGGYSIWLLTKPMDGLVGLLALFITAFWLYCAVGYLLAAFLLSRPSLAERLTGGIFDATATAFVTAVIFWLAGQAAASVNSCCQGDPNAVPVVILGALGVVWIAASIPMLAWFLRGAAARFQHRRQEA